jgi:PAS domain S-box-containing protein
MNSPENPDKSKEELLEELERLRDTLEALEAQDPVQELAVSEARYRALVEGSSDFIYVLDSDGRFTFANGQVDNLLGYSRDNIIGKHYSDILHPSDVESLGHAFAERRTGDRATRRMEIRLRSSTGDTREVEMDVRHFSISASGLYRGSDFVGTHGVARDITERKYLEKQRLVLQRVREAVWSMVTAEEINQVLQAIHQGLDTIGITFQHCAVNVVDMGEPPMLYTYSSVESSRLSKPDERMIADTESYAGTIAAIWRQAKPAYRSDLMQDDPHGERERIVELYGPVRSIIDVPFSFGTLTINSAIADAFSERDLAFFEELAEALSEGFRRMEDLQQLALSEQRYRTLVETPNFVVMLLDTEGNYLYVSPQIQEWLGYTPEEFYRDGDIRKQIIHPDDLVATEEFHHADLATAPQTMTYRWRDKDGEYRWASGAIFPIYESTEDQQIHRASMMQVVVQDITERKVAEELIKSSLAEKEVMLKEIHHRVKNNLQIISSLLHLQSSKLEDDRLTRAFGDSQHRIRSMALIHEELYESDDLARIEFVGYLRRLTEHLFESFGIDESRIRLTVDVQNVLLTIERAIPLSLIINELLSNALKHAFPGNRSGEIHIQMRDREDGPFSLMVTDDGVGLPDIDINSPDSLGLRLVNTLVSQLGAEMRLDRTSGTAFVVERS